MQQFAQKRAFCVDFLSACQCDVELLLNLQQLQFKVLVCRHGLGDQAVGALHRLMIPRKAGRGKRILHDGRQSRHSAGGGVLRVQLKQPGDLIRFCLLYTSPSPRDTR